MSSGIIAPLLRSDLITYFKTPGIADFGLSIADYVIGQSTIRNPQSVV